MDDGEGRIVGKEIKQEFQCVVPLTTVCSTIVFGLRLDSYGCSQAANANSQKTNQKLQRSQKPAFVSGLQHEQSVNYDFIICVDCES